MKFAKRGDRIVKQQTFDRAKITQTKCGQTYNVYDAIQAANVDTDIYEVITKYKCTTDQALQIMQERGGIKGIFGDIREMQSKCETIADLMNLQQKYQTEWQNLPLEIRNKYGHNLQKFLQDLQKQQKPTEPAKTSEVTNEQK